MIAVERLGDPLHDILVHRFGTAGARPKIYMQGALHADEVSATLALSYLCRLLDKADRDGLVFGEVIVVPHCNPAGLSQFTGGRHIGRFDLRDGRNFNRGFPEIGDAVVKSLRQEDIRHLVAETAISKGKDILASAETSNPGDEHRLRLMNLSWGADFIIDVHADWEATLHLYCSSGSWPQIAPLAALLGCGNVILADEPADSPFDEAHAFAWRKIKRFLQDNGVEATRDISSCTVELRGLSDVEPTLAQRDAEAFFQFLCRVGAIAEDAGVPSACAQPIQTTRLNDVELIISPVTGILVHCKRLGDDVKAGDIVARVFDPNEPDPERAWSDLASPATGAIFARWHQRVVRKGMAVCKIASDGKSGTGSGRLPD